jgi:anti-anti-sigma regulatory factor
MNASVGLSENTLWVTIEGTLDLMAASALRARLGSTHRPVVLDFSRVRDVHDLGLAVLAHGLAKDGIAATYYGLSHHQRRVLQYLGFDFAGSTNCR